MAKHKQPRNLVNQRLKDNRVLRSSWPEVSQMMMDETTSVLSDYIIQIIGQVNDNAIFINQDLIQKSQNYQGLVQYDLYAEVGRDPHISSIINTLKIMISCLEWEVKPFSESSRDKAIADYIRDCFEGLDNFSQDMYELNDAIFMGFSCSEVIYKVNWQVSVDKIMNRPQRRIQFDATTREPKLRSRDNPFYGNKLPENKIIVHRTSSMHENPFGDALAQNIYWMWLFKRLVLKYWATHLEHGVAPVPIVKHPPGGTGKLKDEAMDIARHIRQAAFGRMPNTMELIFAEAKNMSQAGMSYKDFLEFCDDQATKAILGQVLTTEGGGRSGAGSRALGDVHMDVLQSRIIFYANALACTLTSTLVKWLTDYNFSSIEGYPKFKFVTKKAIDRKTEAEIIKILHDAGKEVENTYVEDVLEIPLQEITDVPAPVIPEVPGAEKSDTKVDAKGNLVPQT